MDVLICGELIVCWDQHFKISLGGNIYPWHSFQSITVTFFVLPDEEGVNPMATLLGTQLPIADSPTEWFQNQDPYLASACRSDHFPLFASAFVWVSNGMTGSVCDRNQTNVAWVMTSRSSFFCTVVLRVFVYRSLIALLRYLWSCQCAKPLMLIIPLLFIGVANPRNAGWNAFCWICLLLLIGASWSIDCSFCIACWFVYVFVFSYWL